MNQLPTPALDALLRIARERSSWLPDGLLAQVETEVARLRVGHSNNQARELALREAAANMRQASDMLDRIAATYTAANQSVPGTNTTRSHKDPLYSVGEVVRYDKGSTAFMIVREVHAHPSGQWVYWGEHVLCFAVPLGIRAFEDKLEPIKPQEFQALRLMGGLRSDVAHMTPKVL